MSKPIEVREGTVKKGGQNPRPTTPRPDPPPQGQTDSSGSGSHRTDFARRQLFRRGFGDGARGAVLKREDEPDYMEGWEAGYKALGEASQCFQLSHGLKPPSILRAQE